MMLGQNGYVACCDGSAGSSVGELGARRRLLKAAVLARPDRSGRAAAGDGAGPRSETAGPPRVTAGTVVDASPHVLTICRADRTERLSLMPATSAWKGGPADPTVLRTGDRVVVRLDPSRRGVADRIWANIGRVAGVIVERDRGEIVVDAGATRGRQVIVIPRRAEGRIQVRFPRLEPGYLIDIIGLRRGGVFEGLIPATSQPAYRADQVPRPSPVGCGPLSRLGGTATWHEPVGLPDDVEGIGYPMLDPDPGCGDQSSPYSCRVRMPYLCVGSLVDVRNDCTGESRLLPVTSCAAVARLFSDRCVTCGTSPRGRVADLALASFVTLGGELERGCFNATITIDR
jgi:hypothetical protein